MVDITYFNKLSKGKQRELEDTQSIFIEYKKIFFIDNMTTITKYIRNAYLE